MGQPDPGEVKDGRLAEELREALRVTYGWTPAPGSRIAELIDALLARHKVLLDIAEAAKETHGHVEDPPLYDCSLCAALARLDSPDG